MSDNNEFLLRLLANGLTQSKSINVPLRASGIGKPLLEKGACKAVVLRLNEYVRDTETQTDAPYFYYGDSNEQNIEVLRGINSQVVFCDDLSEVFVRYPVLSGRDAQIVIRVIVYN